MLLHRLLFDAAERHPDKLAFHWVDRDRSWTYAEAAAEVLRVAGALSALGVGPGDRVTVFAHNGLDYLAAMFGAWRIGAISALVNVQYADTLDYYLGDHEPSVVIYTHDMFEPIDRARRAGVAAGTWRHSLCLDGAQDGALSWPELLAATSGTPPEATDESAVAHLSYTSGTSGRPKGACLAHEATARATNCIAERLRLRPGDVSFGPTALSSSYQLVANLLPPLHRTCSINVMGRWNPSAGFDALVAREATVLVGNPIVLTDVLVEARRREGAAPPALRMGLSGGGPVPPTLKRAWRDELGLPLVESYGQSELGGFFALGAPELPTDERLLAIGTALPDKELRIMDHEGGLLPPGEVGEMVLRGGFMAGYWGRPERTAEALAGGWLHSGDLGYLDRDGYLFLRGRVSERIIVAGEAWFPRDVEEALATHPGVKMAALVGVTDDELGQRPMAFVLPMAAAGGAGGTSEVGSSESDAGLTADELRRWAAEALGRSLEVMEVAVVDSLPMTPTGKIAKAELAAAAAHP
ncbi:MAG: class I adenylate-forming enzyme family protein [Acidimicrobiia bacterium]